MCRAQVLGLYRTLLKVTVMRALKQMAPPFAELTLTRGVHVLLIVVPCGTQEAKLLPSKNRQVMVTKRVKHEFRMHRGETDASRVEFLLRFAEVSIDNLQQHREHLVRALSGANSV